MKTQSDRHFQIQGAGVAGLAIASELVGRGAHISIYDPNGQPDEHCCSWWAGGMLAPFCEGELAEEPVIRLGQKAAVWWQKQGVKVTKNGSLVVALARDKTELSRFARRTEQHQFVDEDAITFLEPDLAGRIRHGLFFETESHLSPRDALTTLYRNLVQENITIIAEVAPQKTDAAVIDCRGLSARDALHDLRGVKGEMLVLYSPDITLSRPIRMLHPRHPLYIVPRGEGVFMLGATQIESSDRTRASVRSVLELLSVAFALHPAFGEAEILEIGVDARPAFPDNLPRIRHLENKIYANGLFRHGFLLAPALAEMTADYCLNGIKPEVMDEYHS